jgi:hypothetical protein
MKNLFISVLWLIFLVNGSFTVAAQTEQSKPRLHEQFNQITSGYAKAILDSYLVSLNAEPQAAAFIIVYGKSSNDCVYVRNAKTKKNELKAVLPLKGVIQPRRINFYRNYLINIRGFDPSRLVIVDGGYRENEATELWIVSPGQDNPTPTPTLEEKNIRFRKGKLKPSDIVGDCPSST